MAAQVAAFMQRLLNFFHCNTLLQDNFEQFRLSIPDASCLTNGIFFGKLLLKGFSYFQDWGYTEKKKKNNWENKLQFHMKSSNASIKLNKNFSNKSAKNSDNDWGVRLKKHTLWMKMKWCAN